MKPKIKKRLAKEILIFWGSLGVILVFYFIVLFSISVSNNLQESKQDEPTQELNATPFEDENIDKYLRLKQELHSLFDSLESFGYEDIENVRFQLFYSLKHNPELNFNYPAPDGFYCLDTQSLRLFHRKLFDSNIITDSLESFRNRLFTDCFDENFQKIKSRIKEVNIEKDKLPVNDDGIIYTKDLNFGTPSYSSIKPIPPSFYPFFFYSWIVLVVFRILWVSIIWAIKNRR